ncbi:HAD family hydrolase [Streptomyces johnsoniae]|uniref:HAD-IA family hydrolase n=1 Tax=Streptomyces johnsoniae TaxID=3075532 RepID=A0ABU2SD07_9ACTN|nr:HAD-IA family hydrolase [Streptomyces sp. DSM 41886]MDT0446299.1 HAD-IA family hydrolase [Streptomyces sp. DSM 41886]
MAITGVLFDFSGTLMRIEPAVSWLGAAAERTGISFGADELRRKAAELEAAGALPGGASPRSVPPGLAELWRERDRDASRHRALYTGLARQVPLPRPELYEALYERHWQPAAWQPYPDTAEVLGELSERGVGIAVVSNIGWDVRPVFRAHGLEKWIDTFVLSFEHGIQKPDTRLFRMACDRLGLAPQHALMVGDDPVADAGAAALGCAVHLVPHLPAPERPDGLRPVLRLVG